MVKLKLSPQLKDLLSTTENIMKYSEIRPILTELEPRKITELLKNCEFVFPEEPKPCKSERILQLEHKYNENKYQEMVKNIAGRPEGTKENLGEGIRIGTSMISIMLFGLASGYFFGKYFLEWDYELCLVLGFATTVVSLYAEVLLYIIKTNKK